MSSIADHFRGVVASQPDAVALTTAQRRYTYAEIDRWSDAIAAHVAAASAPLDRPVAIVTRDNVALVAAAMGVVKAGHFFVMIDASDPAERIEWILRESSATLTLTGDALRFPADVVPAPPPRAPNDLVYVVFTSGTTGKPKAVATRQRHFVSHILAQSPRLGRAPGSRCTYTALPGFVRAANNIFGTLLAGATMCAFDARSESLQSLAAYIARERITMLTLTPSLFRRLAAAVPGELDLSSVRTFRLGADRVTVADVLAFKKLFPRGCKLLTGFASTESGSVFGMEIDHDTPVPGPLVPMGRPFAGVEVKLIDEDGNEVADGETGEIVVRSHQVADGYWNDPELTAQRFVIDPATPDVRTFFTGDLARRDGHGVYYFVGRRDARLKIHGRRIDPSEVEGALLAGGDVREAVVIGKSEANGDQQLVAYVVPQDGRPFDPRALRAALRTSLPVWMVPSRIYAIDAIPFTRANKVDRDALAARVDDVDSGEDVEQAGDALEQQLLRIWSRVIGANVRLDDDFFDDFGGESVVAAHLVTEVQRETGYAIPLSFLLELNTVRRMAMHLRGTAEVDRLAVRIVDGGPKTPLFIVSGGGGSVLVFRRLAKLLGGERPVYGLHHHGFQVEAFPKTRSAMAACYAESIRRVQPRGPYHLCGYSAGGKLAFEVARQLTRAGEEVAFVGVIDTAVNRDRVSAAKRLRNRIEFLRRRPVARVRGYVVEMLVRRPITWYKRWKLVTEANRAYVESRGTLALEPYSGTVTLFRARHGLGAICPVPDLGWLGVGVGRLDILDVDGDHRSILMEDAPSLAAAIRGALPM